MKYLKISIIAIGFLVIVKIVLVLSSWILQFEDSLGEPVAITVLEGKQVVQKKYGALMLTDYGYPTLVVGTYTAIKRGFHVDKQTFCLFDPEFCVEDVQVHINETPGNMLKVWTYPKNEVYLFNKHAGKLLSCINCKDAEYFDQILNATFHWSSDGNQAIVVNSSEWFNKQYGELYPIPGGDKNYNAKKYGIWKLDFLPTGVYVSEIIPNSTEYKFGEPLDVAYSPNQDFIAWHLCDPKCNLWRYDIAKETYSSVAYPCTTDQYNGRWLIVWSSNVPRTEYHVGTVDRQKCFQEDGAPAFSTQVRPSS